MSVVVRMTGITKRFGSVTALDGVDLAVEQGTIHAVVGENGAGKTTLMRVLYGALHGNDGQLELDGKPVRFASSAEAIAAGIGMVSQHYGIIPEITCLENLILGAEGGAVIDYDRARQKADALAAKMGFHFEWSADASTLTPAGAQKLEILKLLWRNSRIMILDEPTAMLSPSDSDALFASLNQLVAEGATVILVTHRLPEVIDHSKQVTVLRGGKLVADMPVAETNARDLARMIVGGAEVGHEPPPSRPPGDLLLAIRDLVVRGARGDEALKQVSLEIRQGEIVGIAGVDGSGQRELFQAIVGLSRALAGNVAVLGLDDRASTRDRLRAGLRVIPEDRHEEGVIEEWSLEENSALGLQRLSPLANGGAVDTRARRAWSERVAARFRTKHGGLGLPMASLSGGNQQRFVAARALEMQPRLILAFQPARGLDLLGTADIYRAIRERCDEGAGALVVSFDLDELLEHCDRIVAMNLGRLHHPERKDRDEIGRLMVGAQ